MTTLLLNLRLVAGLLLVAALAFTHFSAYRKGRQDVLTAQMAATAEANEDARRLERARQSRADQAAAIRAGREAGNRAALDVARRERDSLRDDLSSALDFAAESHAAAKRVAGVAADLLGRCTKEYLGVAEAAARADSEARELREGWPK